MYWKVSFMIFAEWLNQELENRGITSAELAAKGGLTAPTVWRIINGTRTAGVDSIIGIARGLGLSPVEVFCRSIGQDIDTRTADQERLLYQFALLSETDKTHLMNYIDFLLSK